MTKFSGTDEKLLIDLEDYALETDPDFELVGDEDIARLASVLAQSTHNNIIYAGASGVGKTATLLGMALRKKEAMDDASKVTETGIPMHMIDRRYKILDVNALFDYGDPESISRDVKKIFSELEMPGSHVLVIEDMNEMLKGIEDHQAYGLISSIMREIRRGGFQAIWMVREEPAKNKLEEVLNCHSDVRENFTVVRKKEPSKEKIEQILSSRKSRLEKHFEGLDITDEAVAEVVSLTSQYPSLPIWTRSEPARSISFLDAAASTFVSRGQTRPPELTALEKRLAEVSVQVRLEENEGNMPLKAEERELQGQVDEMRESWRSQAQALFLVQNRMREYQNKLDKNRKSYEKEREEVREKLTAERKEQAGREPTELELMNAKTQKMRDLEAEERHIRGDLEKIVAKADELKNAANRQLTLGKADVQNIFSAYSGIPSSDFDKDETEKLLTLEDRLNGKVFGQEESVDVVANSIRSARAGFKDPRQPMGVFVCLGSSGVGKSFLAECTAEILFDDKDALTSFDMSEYMEKHTVSRLIGAPPGYAGYGDGGLLTNAVRGRPYQALLFDEIEKAHPDVFKIMLQLFDKGRLTDELGTVKFNNTVVFLTTNLQQELALSGEIDPTTEEGQARIKKDLLEFFPQELINRIDGFLLFNPLKPGVIQKILTRDVQKMNEVDGLAKNNMRVNLPEADIARIVEDRYVVREGARQVQKFLSQNLGGHLAKMVFKHKGQDGGTIDAHYDPENNGFRFKFIANDNVANTPEPPVSRPSDDFKMAAP